MDTKKMQNVGNYMIWLTGSRKTIKRAVYQDGTRYFIKWYGQIIEVARNASGAFYSVEEY